MKLQDIHDAITARLEDIQTLDGYNTNAGIYVMQGQQAVTEHDPMPRLAVVPGQSTRAADTGKGGRAYTMETRWTITGMAECTQADPYAAGYPLLEDMMSALQRWDDPTLGGLLVNLMAIQTTEIQTDESQNFVFARLELTTQHIETY